MCHSRVITQNCSDSKTTEAGIDIKIYHGYFDVQSL